MVKRGIGVVLTLPRRFQFTKPTSYFPYPETSNQQFLPDKCFKYIQIFTKDLNIDSKSKNQISLRKLELIVRILFISYTNQMFSPLFALPHLLSDTHKILSFFLEQPSIPFFLPFLPSFLSLISHKYGETCSNFQYIPHFRAFNSILKNLLLK